MDKCKVKGCSRKIRVKKHMLCSAHLARYMKTGEVNPSVKVRKYDKIKPFTVK